MGISVSNNALYFTQYHIILILHRRGLDTFYDISELSYNTRFDNIIAALHKYFAVIIPPHNEIVGGYIGFTPSVCPSVCPSIRPASRVRSVAPTVLVGSISYLYIISSNFRRCVNLLAKFQNLNFGSFFEFVILTLSCFDLTSDVNH